LRHRLQRALAEIRGWNLHRRIAQRDELKHPRASNVFSSSLTDVSRRAVTETAFDRPTVRRMNE
jgi:hypothetical protein